MRIGKLATRSGTPVDTVRYYERIGLLPPPARSASNYRDYGEAQLRRLDFIRRCRALDMSLAEVRRLLDFCEQPARDCAEVDAMLDAQVVAIERRIGELAALAAQLRQLRAVCRRPGTADRCGILLQLRSDTGGGTAAARNAGRRPATRNRRS